MNHLNVSLLKRFREFLGLSQDEFVAVFELGNRINVANIEDMDSIPPYVQKSIRRHTDANKEQWQKLLKELEYACNIGFKQ